MFDMRHPIETAPKDGKFVILEDDATGIYDVALWSPEAGKWIGKNSEQTRLAPTHWHPLVRDASVLQEDEVSSNRPSPRRSLRRHRKELYIGATVAAGFLAFYATREAAPHDSVKFIGQTASQAAQLLSQSWKIIFPASRLPHADQNDPPKAQVASGQQTRQSQKEERADVLAQELAEARQTIGRLDLQLREEIAKGSRSLEQERNQSAALALETTAARNELAASSARYSQALDEERARGAALERGLATAKTEIEAQAARLQTARDEAEQRVRAEAAKSLQSLEQERKRSAALALEAAAARNELAAGSARYRQTLDEERARRAALESGLATAKTEIEAQAARLRTARDEAEQVARAEFAKNLQSSLEQERKRSAAVAQEAAAARTALVPRLADFGQAIEEEKARAAALEGELVTARREIERQAARLRPAGNESEHPEQVPASSRAKLDQSPQPERDRTAAMARDIAPANAIAQVTPEPAKRSQTPDAARVLEVVAVPPTTAADAQSSPEATRLIARASALLSQGDIGAARTVLESAAETGSARASFMLAQTYDPAVLATWGTFGTRGEVVKAREHYAKAHAGGIQEAKDRLNALQR